MSKEEYRRRFEEQVKANDELAEQYKQMQEQAEAAAYQQQYYTVNLFLQIEFLACYSLMVYYSHQANAKAKTPLLTNGCR